ncbi:MAG: BrnA antitoxin family protein [Rickettsiales bacterium]|jgi:predicted DNA binding CopG/RHH family protein|nr:BrnA antitoxin family protein [Rickettsiales bacterium]
MNNMLQQLFIMNADEMLKNYAVFRAFHKSDSVINMRIPAIITEKLKELAQSKGIPYQTLITATLYALVNIEESDKQNS